MAHHSSVPSSGSSAKEPYIICITSILSTAVRGLSPIIGFQRARKFLRETGGHVEIFFPFYKWHNKKGKLRRSAFLMFRFFHWLYGAKGIQVVHTGFAEEKFLSMKRRFYLNVSDPNMKDENIARIRAELDIIGMLRQKYAVANPVLYVLHLGRVEKGVGREKSHQAAISVIQQVLPDALRVNVCITVENVYSKDGYEHVGTSLHQLGEILRKVGVEWVERGAFGWTFDLAHALLEYRGDYDAIERDLQSILPFCVHVHVNHPRTLRSRPGKVLSKWGRGDDYHVAPVFIPRRERFWNLLRITILNSKVPERRTLTYEVGLELPVFNSLTGGSAFREVRLGRSALDRFCNHPTEAFDVDAICRYLDTHESTYVGN